MSGVSIITTLHVHCLQPLILQTTLLHQMVNYVVVCIEPCSAGTMISAVQQAKEWYNLIENRLQDMTTMFFGYTFMLNK